MSIFDVIRYGSTDLGNSNELENLPDELLERYWDKFLYLPTSWPKNQKAHHLSNWYIICSPNNSRNRQQVLFKEALKEYSDEHL